MFSGHDAVARSPKAKQISTSPINENNFSFENLTPSILNKARSRASPEPEPDTPGAARVLPFKVHSLDPSPSPHQDKENVANFQESPGKGPRQGLGPQRPQTEPVAPPPTLSKAAKSDSFFETFASDILQATLNFPGLAEKHASTAFTLNKASAKLASEVQVQLGKAAQKQDQAHTGKSAVVNQELAAKLARRRGWENESEAAIKETVQERIQNAEERDLIERQMARERVERELAEKAKERELDRAWDREAKDLTLRMDAMEQRMSEDALLSAREKERPDVIPLSAVVPDLGRDWDAEALGGTVGSAASDDTEMDELEQARKEAQDAAQQAALKQKAMEVKISSRKLEKQKLRLERKRLEDEVRKAAADAVQTEHNYSARFNKPRVVKTISSKSSSSSGSSAASLSGSLDKPLVGSSIDKKIERYADSRIMGSSITSTGSIRTSPSSSGNATVYELPTQTPMANSSNRALQLLERADRALSEDRKIPTPPDAPPVQASAGLRAEAAQGESARGASLDLEQTKVASLRVDGRLTDILDSIEAMLRGDPVQVVKELNAKAAALAAEAESAREPAETASVDESSSRTFLDKTVDLVATPHHKLKLQNEMVFATPGTTSHVVNDWCQSLEVKTRPIPREEVNTEEAGNATNSTLADYPVMQQPSEPQTLSTPSATFMRQGAVVSSFDRADPMATPSLSDQKTASSRVAKLDHLYHQLEQASQMALETAFNQNALLDELSASCTKLTVVIREYEDVKGISFADSHSYIRLKNRLADRVKVLEMAEQEKAKARENIANSELLPQQNMFSSFKSWADLPFQSTSTTPPESRFASQISSYSASSDMLSPLSPAMDTPRVGLRISKKQSGQVVVVDVIPGTPAQVSGQVHAGDVVEQADGQYLMGMYISDIVNVMSGSPKCCGTVLVLKILRDSSARLTVRITRSDKREIVQNPQAPVGQMQNFPLAGGSHCGSHLSPLPFDAPKSARQHDVVDTQPPLRPVQAQGMQRKDRDGFNQRVLGMNAGNASQQITDSSAAPIQPTLAKSLGIGAQHSAPRHLPLPSRPTGPAGADSMRAWMSQPTDLAPMQQVAMAEAMVPRLKQAGGDGVHMNRMPRVNVNLPAPRAGGWFAGGFLSSVNGVVGGMTQNILGTNMSTLFRGGDVFKELQKTQKDRRCPDETKHGLSYHQRHFGQSELTYPHPLALSCQPQADSTSYSPHPDSPGALHHAMLQGKREGRRPEQSRKVLQQEYLNAPLGRVLQANEFYTSPMEYDDDGSSGLLM